MCSALMPLRSGLAQARGRGGAPLSRMSRAAEAAPPALQTRLRTVLDTMLEGVVVLSAVRDEAGRIVDFRIDDANPAIIRSSLLGPAERIGHTLLELFPADRANGLFDAYINVVETGVPFEVDSFHVLDPDAAGGPLDQFLDLRAAKLGDGYVLTVRDVTAVRRSEDALRASEARLRQFFDTPTIGTLVVRRTGEVLEANDYFLTLLGHTRDELARGEIDWRTISPPEWLPVSEHAIEEASARGTSAPYEKEYLRPDGSRVPVLLVTMSMPGADDLLSGVVLDMTRAKLDARERERLVAAVEQSADGIVMTDPDWRVSYANAAFAASVGRPSSELVGRSAKEVASLGLDTATVAALERTVSDGERWSTEVDHVFPDGAVHRFETNIRPIRDLSGGISSWVGVLRDVTDRHFAQVSLAASEQRLRTALDTTLEGVVVISAVRDDDGRVVDFRIEYANPALSEISGVLPEAQVGHRLLELFPAHRTNGLFDAYVGVVETGVPFESGPFRYVDPDAAGGSLDQVLEQRAAKLGDGCVLSVRDVTERHHAEREMRRLSTAIEQSSDAVVITDTGGAIQYVNPAFEQVTGYTSAEVIGQNPRILKSGVQGPAFYAAMWATLASGQPFIGDLVNRRKDGSLFEEEAVISPIRDEAGTITSYVAVKRDITERKRLETERASLAAAVEQAADFIVVNDSDGIVQAANPAFERLTGYPVAEAIGRPVASLLRSGVDPPEVYAALDEAFRRGDPWSGRLVERRADGSVFPVDLSVSPIRDVAGHVIGHVEIGHDRTREAELEAERDRAARLREALGEALHAQLPDASLETAAQALCDQLAGLPEIDFVIVFLLGKPGEIQSPSRTTHRRASLRRTRARRSARRACTSGPWKVRGPRPGCRASTTGPGAVPSASSARERPATGPSSMAITWMATS